MSTKRWKVLASIFLAITVLSVGVLIKETLNYTKFYEAYEKLALEPSNLNISTTAQEIIIRGKFALKNPTGYYGLELLRLDLLITFVADDVEIELATDTMWRNREPINPYSNITFNFSGNLTTNSDRGRFFIQASSQGPVECMIRSQVFLATLFGPTDAIDLEPQHFTYQKP